MNVHILSATHYREMGAIARILHTRNDTRFPELGLQKGQFVFLTRLCEHPGVTVVRLARVTRVDQTTATKAVQKLEGAGYLTRNPDPDDGRSHTLWPTEKAFAAYAALVEAENADLTEGLEGFTPDEAALLLAFLVRLRVNLERAS